MEKITKEESRRIKKRIEILKKSITYIILSLVSIIMILPFLWMISTSLKEAGAVFTYPPKWIPHPVVFKNYLEAWNAVPFGRFFINSIFVAFCVTIGQVTTSSLAAYAFARLEFPGRDKLFFLYLATMMIPGQITICLLSLIRKTMNY